MGAFQNSKLFGVASISSRDFSKMLGRVFLVSGDFWKLRSFRSLCLDLEPFRTFLIVSFYEV